MNQSEPIYHDPKLPIRRIVMGSQVCDAHLSVHDWDYLQQLYAYVGQSVAWGQHSVEGLQSD